MSKIGIQVSLAHVILFLILDILKVYLISTRIPFANKGMRESGNSRHILIILKIGFGKDMIGVTFLSKAFEEI
jgi:hypothetical protein